MLITYNMPVCKTRHMHVCASPLMHCPPLALPHRPTARYSHKRRRHLYICDFHFLRPLLALHPRLPTVPQKLPAQSLYPVCSAELDLLHTVYERNLRFTDTRPQGHPGPRLSLDKNFHDHLPLPGTAATASCAQVDGQTNGFTHSIHPCTHAKGTPLHTDLQSIYDIAHE